MTEPWTARVLTLFPEMFPGPLGVSLTGRALADGLWRLEALDIRAHATDRHRTVDDTPAGGGPGMVMRADIAARALDAARTGAADWPALYLSPRGRPFTQSMARRLAAAPGVILLCGRFEGLDQRLLDARPVEEVSLGDFILTGGNSPPSPCSTRRFGLYPASSGTPSRWRRNPSPPASWSTRNTPARPSGKAVKSPRFSSRATTAGSPNGARRKRNG